MRGATLRRYASSVAYAREKLAVGQGAHGRHGLGVSVEYRYHSTAICLRRASAGLAVSVRSTGRSRILNQVTAMTPDIADDAPLDQAAARADLHSISCIIKRLRPIARRIVEEIYGQLTSIMRDIFDNDDLVAEPTLSADMVEGWDSLAHVRLMLEVQRAFKVKFAAAELTSFKNVGDLAKLIAAKTSAKENP